MCLCTPNIRTPFCGKPGCGWPAAEVVDKPPHETAVRLDADYPVSIDRAAGTITICGVVYDFDLFKWLGFGEIGSACRIIARENGVVTVERLAA